MLAQFFEVYPAYGRSPKAAESIVGLFMFALADFPIDKITEAMGFHLANNKQFPVPADIAHIIRRGNKPPFSESLFIAIQKKPPDERDHEEWVYLRDYQEYMIRGQY